MGGKSSWGGVGGSQTLPAFTWTTTLNVYDMYSIVTSKIDKPYPSDGSGVVIEGWDPTVGSSERLSMWLPMRFEYDGGDISWQWFGWADNGDIGDQYTFKLRSRWIANDDSINQSNSNADSQGRTLANGNDRSMISGGGTFTPDGTWAVNKQLLATIESTQSNPDGDKPRLSQIRYTYGLTL